MKDLLTWLGTLPPLLQVPIIVGLFLIVATVLILLIEVAPRPGTRFTVIRLIACIAIPGLIFLLLGSVWWAVAVAVVLGGLFFLLDYRSREGKGYVFALVGFVIWCWFTIRNLVRNGQSIAKKMLAIKVVRRDGSPVSLGRLFWLRNAIVGVLGVIPLFSIIDALFIFGESRQCIHDKIADTIVVLA